MDVAQAQVSARTGGTHPDGQYTTVAKWFHWATLVPLAIALPSGFVLEYIANEPFATKVAFYAWHSSAGLTILFVTLARLGWRIANPPPPLPDHIPAPMRLAAGSVHWLLYLGLIVQPILGLALAGACGYPTYLGPIAIPAVMAEDDGLAETLGRLHAWVAYSIAALLAVHIAASVYHHAIRRDGTLMRML